MVYIILIKKEYSFIKKEKFYCKRDLVPRILSPNIQTLSKAGWGVFLKYIKCFWKFQLRSTDVRNESLYNSVNVLHAIELYT